LACADGKIQIYIFAQNMNQFARRLLPPLIRSQLGIPLSADLSRFDFDQSKDISAHIKKTLGYDGEMLRLFAGNKGKVVHKWHHYIPLYDKYFSQYRGTKVRMLEIGVSKGGSLAMWRKYFGEDAVLYGIDIDPSCAAFDGDEGQIRIGSQDDKQFLESIVSEMGGIDIVLDDGSHIMKHIKSSLKILFPLLEVGGTYFIEDLHTCYWKKCGGGYRSKQNFFQIVGDLIDDMHHWYHDARFNYSDISPEVKGIHIHDSIVVLEKGIAHNPVVSQVG